MKFLCCLSLFLSFYLAAFGADSPSVRVINKGIAGHTAEQGQKRFERDVMAFKPRWLILYFGMNDALNQNVPVERYAQVMQEMVDRARSGGVEHVILVTPNPFIEAYLVERHPEHPEAGNLKAHLEKYERKIRELAAKENLPLVDLKQMILENGGATEEPDSLIRNPLNSKARDGIHLTAEGYRRFAGLFVPLFEGKIRAGDTVVCLGDSLTFGSFMKGEGTSEGETYPAFLKASLNAIVVQDKAPEAGATKKEALVQPVLKNEKLELRFFPPEEGAGISQIINPRGFEFIGRNRPAPLWKILLRKSALSGSESNEWATLSIDPEKDDGTGENVHEGDSLEISSLQAPARLIQKDQQLVFVWEGLDVGDEKKALSVTVEVHLAESDPFARIRGRFELNSAKYTAFYFHAPCVQGISPKDGRLDLDHLASPIYNGRLIINPITNGILGKKSYFMPNRGGHSMQFDAYYHEGNGLYLGAFDKEQNAVRYAMSASPDEGLSWSMVHVPNNMTSVPQKWETPYETVIRCFDGDWYDACRIYREWALKQSWTAEGPLVTRKSTPEWFKDIDEWLLMPVSEAYAGSGMANGLGVAGFKKKLEGFNVGLAINAWGKHQEFDKLTPDRFPITRLDQKLFSDWRAEPKYPMMGYIQAISWDKTLPDFIERNARDYTVKTFSGRSLMWVGQLAIMYPSPFWRERLGDVVEQMVGEGGFQAAYLDSGNHAGTYLNFNKKCSDEIGGGNRYIKNMQQLILETRARARKISPGFCLTSESFWEGNIAVLDGFLACNTTNVKLEKDKFLAVPMVQAVYHDYTILFSSWVGKHDLEQPGATGYLAKFGQTFVWGVKPAWNQVNFLTTYGNHALALESSLKRYAAYAAGRKFLQYGEMLRPPEFLNPVKDIEFKWYVAWSNNFYNVALPQVLKSLWRAPDGNLGLVLYNIGAEPCAVDIVLNDPNYDLSEMDKSGSRMLFPGSDRSIAVKSRPEGGFQVAAVVPPASPLIVEIPRQAARP